MAYLEMKKESMFAFSKELKISHTTVQRWVDLKKPTLPGLPELAHACNTMRVDPSPLFRAAGLRSSFLYVSKKDVTYKQVLRILFQMYDLQILSDTEAASVDNVIVDRVLSEYRLHIYPTSSRYVKEKWSKNALDKFGGIMYPIRSRYDYDPIWIRYFLEAADPTEGVDGYVKAAVAFNEFLTTEDYEKRNAIRKEIDDYLDRTYYHPDYGQMEGN